jgi:hypothetical protein
MLNLYAVWDPRSEVKDLEAKLKKHESVIKLKQLIDVILSYEESS